ncbi:MAG: LptF/LptG family permease [Candidatus Sumerlaeia bacterium]
MKILQRYVLREVLIPTIMSMMTLTFVLLIQMLFQRATDLAGAISFDLLLRFIWYILPTLFVLTVPMSILTGVLLGIGRMTVDSEVRVFRTHGVNLFRVFLPVLVLGFLIAGFSLFNGLYWAPGQMQKGLALVDELKYQLVNALEPGRFEDRLSTKGAEVVLYFEEKDQESGRLKNVYLSIKGMPSARERGGQNAQRTEEDEQMKTLFLASSGRIRLPFDPKAESEEDHKAILELYNGSVHFMRDREDDRYGILKFDKLKQEFNLDEEGQSRSSLVSLYKLNELNEAIEKELAKDREENRPLFNEEGQRLYNKDVQFMRAEIYQRFSISLACICFVLIGLPLAIYIRPSGKSVGVAIAFCLLAAYYGVMHYGVILTRQKVGLSPEIGPYLIFAPNVILALVGGFMFYRTVHR